MKKVLSTILGVCLLTSLSVSSFAASEVDTHSMDVPETAAHVHSFRTTGTYTERMPCWSNGGEHTSTYEIRECSCGAVVHTNTKNSCGKCATGGLRIA